MSRWFRHYAGMARDEKLVSAAIKSKQAIERVVWIWNAILESAAEVDDHGRFELDSAEVAYFLRADEADIRAVIDALTASARLADGCVVNWGARQFRSDRSADRQAAYRERKRSLDVGSDDLKTSRDDDVTSPSRHGDAPELETELETEQISPSSISETRKPARDLPAEALEAYNLEADQAGWPKADKLTPPRRSAIKARLAEAGGIEGWRQAMQRARGSPFLCGDNDRGWRANLDFFLKAKSFTKLLEGAYDGPNHRTNRPSQPAAGRRSGPDSLVAAFLAEASGPDDRGFPDRGTSRAGFAGGPIMDLEPIDRTRPNEGRH